MRVPPGITNRDAPRPSFAAEALVLDLDGTVLDNDVRLHPRIEAAVQEVAASRPVIIATGRMYRSALPWARRLHITCPLVCYQGALVRELPHVDGSPGAVLLEDGVAPDVALHALQVARANGWYFQAYADDDLLCDEDRPEGELYSRIAGVERTIVADLEPIVRSGGSTKGVCVVPDAAEARRCREVLSRELGGAARVTPSRPEFVEVVSPAVSKAEACRAVCAHAGATMQHAVAIGDGPNDIEMLDAAGFAIAVATADDEVLEHADATCPPPEQGGVADALIALGLCERSAP